MKVIGISDGFTGLINKEYRELSENDLSGILTLGGTILGTSREKPFKSDGKGKNDLRKPVLIKEHYEQMGLDCLVCIGGNGTLENCTTFSRRKVLMLSASQKQSTMMFGVPTFHSDSIQQ